MKSRIVISVLAFFMAVFSSVFCMKDLEFLETGRQPTAVCFSTDQKYLVVGHKDGTISVFEKGNYLWVNVMTITRQEGETKKIVFWEHKERIAIVSMNENAIGFSAIENKKLNEDVFIRQDKEELFSVAMNNTCVQFIKPEFVYTVHFTGNLSGNFWANIIQKLMTPLFADFQPLDKEEKIRMELIGDKGSIALYSSKKIVIWDSGLCFSESVWEKAYCHNFPENTVIKSIAFSSKGDKIACVDGCGQLTVLQKNKKIWDVAALNIDPRCNEKCIMFDSSGKKLISISNSLPNNVRLWQLIETKNGIRVEFVNTLTDYGLQTCIHTVVLNPQENVIAVCAGNTVTFKKVSLDVDKPLFLKSQKEELYTRKGSNDSAKKKMPTFGDLKISFF